MLRGIDCSEFTREIPRQWWKDLREDHAVEVAIIQCWGGGPVFGGWNTYFEQQARGALDAGIRIGTYCWPPSEALSATNYVHDSGVPLQVFALDVEAGATTNVSDVAIVRDAGFEPWLYGNRYTIGSMPNKEALRHVPLWLARYPAIFGPIAWPAVYRPYGSAAPLPEWPGPQGWQFQGTTAYRGETMDLNLFQSFPAGGLHMPTPEYEELKEDIRALMAAVGGTNALLADVAQALVAQLERLRVGDIDVPIWPDGPVSLSVVRHRGYHAEIRRHFHGE